jgi:hypothetical protein
MEKVMKKFLIIGFLFVTVNVKLHGANQEQYGLLGLQERDSALRALQDQYALLALQLQNALLALQERDSALRALQEQYALLTLQLQNHAQPQEAPLPIVQEPVIQGPIQPAAGIIESNFTRNPNGSYQCIHCTHPPYPQGKDLSALYHHISYKHTNSDEIHKCPYCHKVYKHDSNLNGHIRKHHPEQVDQTE